MRYKLFRRISTIFLTVVLLVVSSACIPTVSRLYTGAEVSGRIIWLSDFTPVANAKVSYGDTQAASKDNNVVETDHLGQFDLMPNTYLKAEILMPANMTKTTSLNVFVSPQIRSRYVVAGFQDKFITKSDLGTLVLDNNPNELALSVYQEGVDLAELSKAIRVDDKFSGCNQQDGYGAVHLLNVSRKLALQLEQIKAAGSGSHLIEPTQRYLQESLEQTQLIWGYFIYQCNNGKPSQALRELYLQVEQELKNINASLISE